ncbi:uncharacterized protein LOC132797929 [Drosophila nasuta]|uniref:uncharacterized protein LOC132797929 n=1 Tax=Drosophila nasuta TaxID=42062 RepID=UPI00295F508E|nr:uncharacterized protein LOC132797929 [Drosophila nasuta]
MQDHVRIAQLNVNHCSAAQSLLQQTERERKIDIMLLSEPYISSVGNAGVILDSLGKAAIQCCTGTQIEEVQTPPVHTATLWQPAHTTPEATFSRITPEEIVQAARRIRPSKAPGLDGIPGVVVKAIADAKPEIFSRKGNSTDASGYHPLCLLDIVGKLFERVLYRRIEEITEGPSGLSNQQYGFRKDRTGQRWLGGAKEYCAIITLDVKNAFNTAKWISILSAMHNMGIPTYLKNIVGSYFRERILWYDTTEAPESTESRREFHKKARQRGAILLRGRRSNYSCSKTLTELQAVCNVTISAATGWLESVGLKIAAHKTEVVLLSSRKAVETLQITIFVNISTDFREFISTLESSSSFT